ncbi:uncharacterized protein LOC120626089 [Pararge aegeria]|uniref:uncharacterized protein LOC120626089 n=1 Tax=Pararge aegeria TaxID=116150 RepID=UPI0019CF90F3|nr:uncharacterized protein LOC120626089 [Pararge aegeria]
MSNLNDDMRLNIEFVKEVERYPCLYNVHDGEYSNKESVDKAWKEIGERFRGLSGNDLKIKWRSVRSSFSRSFRTKKEYYLGPYLNFLLPFSKSRYIDDSFVEIVKNESENYKLDDDSSRSSSECVLEIVETKCEEEDDEFREQNGNIQVSTLPELKEGQSRGIRKKGSRSQILSQYTKSRLSPHECYLKSLMPDVSAMDQIQFFNFRRGILNILGKIKYRATPATESS